MGAFKTPSVPALERGLAILELVLKSRSGLTFSQIAHNVRFPKSSVHCLLLTFEREGYLRRSETTGRYVCGSRLARMAHLALDGAAIRERATPSLWKLADRIKMAVHMAILENDEVIVVAKAVPPGVHNVSTWMGKRLDVHCTSLGKSLIAHLAESEVERLTQIRGFFRHNENTISSISQLKQDLARSRQRGYSIDDEEEELGVRCVGVPVFSGAGEVLAALSASGTTEQISADNCAAIAALLQSAARDLSATLNLSSETARSA